MSYSNADTGSKTADPYTAKNKDEPSLDEKVKDFTTFIQKTKICLLTTRTPEGKLAARAMALAAEASSPPRPSYEGNGVDLLFHTNTESGKTDDLDAHSEVNVGFINSSGEWASISGTANIETDREKVRKYYSPSLKAWLGDLGDGKHDGGPEDPRIGIIKIKSNTIQYSASGATMVGQAIEVAKGMVTGQAANVNKLRHIEESELQQWRSKA